MLSLQQSSRTMVKKFPSGKKSSRIFYYNFDNPKFRLFNPMPIKKFLLKKDRKIPWLPPFISCHSFIGPILFSSEWTHISQNYFYSFFHATPHAWNILFKHTHKADFPLPPNHSAINHCWNLFKNKKNQLRNFRTDEEKLAFYINDPVL